MSRQLILWGLVLALAGGAQANLIGYWTFDDGDTAAAGGIDDRANATDEHDASLVGGAFSADVPAQLAGTGARSLDLTGGDYYAIVNTFTGTASDNDFNTGGALTISCWIKGWPNDGWEPFVSKRGESGQGWQLRRRGGSNNQGLTLRGTSGDDDPQGMVNLNNANWKHVVGSYDSATGWRIFYANGALDGAVANDSGNITTTGSYVVFGARDNSGTGSPPSMDNYSRIMVDDVAIWNEGLTPNQVTYLSLGGDPTSLPAAEPIGPPQPVVMLGPNGAGGWNAYMIVSDAKNLADAKAAAEAMTFPGMPGVPASGTTGHLASYGSEGEYWTLNGLRRQVNVGDPWIGFTDDPALAAGASEFGNTSALPVPANGSLPNETPGSEERGAGWRFMDGTPNTFHDLSGDAGYSQERAWNASEPNNSPDEDGAVVVPNGVNDLGTGSNQPYLVEWNLNLAGRPMIGPPGGMGYMGIREVRDPANTIERASEAVAFLYNNLVNNGHLLGGTRYDGTQTAIDFVDPDNNGGGGDFHTDLPFLSNRAGDDDNFALIGNGEILVPAAGTYTIHMRGDDGGMIRLPGQAWTAVLGSDAGRAFIQGDAVVFEFPTGNSNVFATVDLPAGVQPIEVIFFELGGGANFEVTAAPGATTDLAQHRVIGSKDPGVPAVPAHDSVVPAIQNVSIIQSDPTAYTGGGPGHPVPDPLGNPNDDNDDIDNLAEAKWALANLNLWRNTPTQVNHSDPDTSAAGYGFYTPDLPLPYDDLSSTPAGAPGTADDDFGVQASMELVILAGGTYYLGFNSDDGAELQVVGQAWTGIVVNETGSGVIVGDTMITDVPTGQSNTVGEINLAMGVYTLVLTMFERSGGAGVELFGGTALDGLGLLGATEYTINVPYKPGVAPALEFVPEPATLALVGLGLLGLLRRKR